jgi:hypothetical protein
MTGPEFASIRKQLGLSLYDWGRALGYQGNRNSLQVQIKGMEDGARAITPMCRRLVRMYERYGVPEDLIASI